MSAWSNLYALAVKISDHGADDGSHAGHRRGGERPASQSTLRAVFGGLLESAQGLLYQIESDRSGAVVPWHVAGPTCDSVDVLMSDQMLPEDLQDGDFLYFPNAGAYTTAYASTFNGFPLPDVRFI